MPSSGSRLDYLSRIRFCSVLGAASVDYTSPPEYRLLAVPERTVVFGLYLGQGLCDLNGV
jgi:hypothetical protein